MNLGNLDERAAGIARERRRPAVGVRVKAREGERAGRVARLIVAVARGLEEKSGPHRMAADGDVEIVGDLQIRCAHGTANLRSARIEGVQHQHGGRAARSGDARLLRSDLKPKLVEERFAKRARRRHSEHVFVSPLAVSTLRQVEIADAEVVRERVVALRFGAKHLRPRERVLDACRHVERVVRLANRVGEQAGRQGGDDRPGVERVDAID